MFVETINFIILFHSPLQKFYFLSNIYYTITNRSLFWKELSTLCCTLSNRIFFFSKYLNSHCTNDSHLSFSRITALLIMQSSNGTTHAWPRREFAQKLQWVGFLYTLVSRLRLIISRRKFLSVIMFLRRPRLRSRQLSWLWTAALFSQRLIHCVKAQLRRRRRRQP